MAYTLEYLTEDRHTIQICDMYWETTDEGKFTHSVKSIADELKIAAHKVPGIVKESCYAYVPGTECDCCSEGFTISTRTDAAIKPRGYRAEKYGFDSVCKRCHEQFLAEEEEARLEAEREQELALIEKIDSCFATTHYSNANARELSLKQALVLHTVMLAGAEEDFGRVRPLETFNGAAFPETDLGFEALDILRDTMLLEIEPYSNLEAFKINADGDLSYYPSSVWHVPTFVTNLESVPAFMSDLNSALDDSEWPDHWHLELDDVYMWIAEAELKSLLRLALGDRGLPFIYGEKTQQALLQLLEHFSLGQAYSFIYRAAVNAVDYQARSGVYGKQASNSIVGHISRNVDRALTEGWTIKPYNRPSSRVPETMLSATFSRKILKLDNEWFHMPLSEIKNHTRANLAKVR